MIYDLHDESENIGSVCDKIQKLTLFRCLTWLGWRLDLRLGNSWGRRWDEMMCICMMRRSESEAGWDEFRPRLDMCGSC
jgi:hypothetical protein